MRNISSGYDSTASNWKAFLQAWRDAPKEYPDISLVCSINLEHGESEAKIDALRQRLGLDRLPASFVDFLRVASVVGTSSDVGGSEIYPLEKIDYLSRVDKEYFEFLKDGEPDSSDAEYFVYGVGQDNATSKNEFLDGMIVIGALYPDDYLLLNSCVQTKDGEFECVLDGHGFRIRTMSFAAMMRFWCVYECNKVDSYPPYPESMLNSGPPSFIKSGV